VMHLASIGPGIGWGLKTALPYLAIAVLLALIVAVVHSVFRGRKPRDHE
jgi:hypothetical protein